MSVLHRLRFTLDLNVFPQLTQGGHPRVVTLVLGECTLSRSHFTKQRAKKFADIGVYADFFPLIASQFGTVDVDLNERDVGREVLSITEVPVQPSAQQQNHIGLRLSDPLNRIHAQWVIVRKRPPYDCRRVERNRPEIHEFAQFSEGRGPSHPLAGNEQRNNSRKYLELLIAK